MICSLDGCERTARHRGWCNLHYERWRIHGSAEWEPPMTFDVLVEEIEWLRDGGMSPALICQALRVAPETLERRLDKHGRRDLARFISPETRVARVS